MQTKPLDIDLIKAGDTVLHNGEVRTVSNSDIKGDGFIGKTIFGDSYHAGNKPVLLVLDVNSIKRFSVECRVRGAIGIFEWCSFEAADITQAGEIARAQGYETRFIKECK